MAKVEERREVNGFALVRIGAAKSREKDDELAAPKAVLAKLPTDRDQAHIAPPSHQIRCSDGVYWVFAREQTTLVKGKKKVALELKRLHWLDAHGEPKAAATLLEPDSLPTFDVERGTAIMGVEGGKIFEIDLRDGAARSIPILGVPHLKDQKFYYVAYVRPDRVLAQCYSDEGSLLRLFDHSGEELVARFSQRQRGEVAITTEGLLLAGGPKLVVFEIAEDGLVPLAEFDEPHLRMGIHPSGAIRCYNAHGTFAVEAPAARKTSKATAKRVVSPSN
jgi:hypothetical protein